MASRKRRSLAPVKVTYGEGLGGVFTTSPYDGPMINLYFRMGLQPLQIHRAVLNADLLGLATDHRKAIEIHLNDISEEAGHMVVHFLYTQTLSCPSFTGSTLEGRYECEFRACLEAYVAARKYALYGLEALVQNQLESLSVKMTVPRLIAILEEVYPRPEQGDRWFPSFIDSCVRRAFDDSKEPCYDDMLGGLQKENSIATIVLRSSILQSKHTTNTLGLIEEESFSDSPKYPVPTSSINSTGTPSIISSCGGDELEV
ncbi:hypothetical protein BGZ63DRAFT_440746 [Mariannaea sp. PMI_226]|nr:hypothetical protein BGZ63DRAFT_440746 [Mariannaea sp. PMI_226]